MRSLLSNRFLRSNSNYLHLQTLICRLLWSQMQYNRFAFLYRVRLVFFSFFSSDISKRRPNNDSKNILNNLPNEENKQSINWSFFLISLKTNKNKQNTLLLLFYSSDELPWMFSDRIIYLRETTKKKGEKKEEHNGVTTTCSRIKRRRREKKKRNRLKRKKRWD